MQIRRSEDRGLADHGWLKSRHSFSFADYRDPAFMGFGPLRVINEDRIRGGTGFGPHPHRDMEIISYVLEGALEHQDSMGNKTVIRPGEVQRMSAGTGVTHSEYNHFPDRETHFLQIWIVPSTAVKPSYGQADFSGKLAGDSPVLVISPDGADGSIAIHQDASLQIARMKEGRPLDIPLDGGRRYWLQVVRGEITVRGIQLQAGDGASFGTRFEDRAKNGRESCNLDMRTASTAEIMLFDLPPP